MSLLLNPDQYIRPNILLCPFEFSNVKHYTPDLNSIMRHFESGAKLTTNGREAILAALLDILDYNKLTACKVLIVTSSNSSYVSSCVTSTIERVGKWTMDVKTDYNVIFIVHEFGVRAKLPPGIKKGVPIIEDFAPSFFLMGRTEISSDYKIVSFPKFFSVQEGGMVIGLKNSFDVSRKLSPYTIGILAYELDRQESIKQQRKKVELKLINGFSNLGFSPFFSDHSDILPWSLMISNDSQISSLPRLKTYFDMHGILLGIFHGHDAFYIPSHQNLTDVEVDYIIRVFESYILNE